MKAEADRSSELFDEWPEKYEQWFATPVGRLVKEYELRLLLELLQPGRDDTILDVGCGTGIFTSEVLAFGSRIVGMDISRPMLAAATDRFAGERFVSLAGDMSHLPFPDAAFDKVYSMTAVEFVTDASRVVEELGRVTKTGGTIVLTTLNDLSPWASKRREKAKKGHDLFQSMIFRAPADLRNLLPEDATLKTAIHFMKNEDPVQARIIEEQGTAEGLDTGAFLAARWTKK